MVVSSSSRSIHCLISLCFSSFSLMDDDVMIALFIFSRIFSKTRRSDTEAMSPFRGFSWRNLRTLLWQIKQESLKSCWKKLKFYSRRTNHFVFWKPKKKKSSEEIIWSYHILWSIVLLAVFGITNAIPLLKCMKIASTHFWTIIKAWFSYYLNIHIFGVEPTSYFCY